MRAERDRSQHFCACPDIDVASDNGDAPLIPASDCNLLKNQAINAYYRSWMDDYAIRVRYQEAPANVGRQRDIRACHDAPEAVAQNDNLAAKLAEKAGACLP